MHARRVFARVGRASFVVDVHPDGRAVVRAVPEGADHPPAEAVTDATSVDAHYLGHGRIRLSTGSRRTLAWAVDAGDTRWVFLEGQVLQVEVSDRPAARPPRGRAVGPESLAAPMPATVVRILVEPGEAVTRGATLVLLEAMKMELPIRAPHDAVVAAVRCAEGDLVQAGTVLVDLQGA